MVSNQENLKGAERPNPFPESEKPSIPGKESYPKRFKRETWRERIGKFFPSPFRRGEKMFERKEKAKPKPPPKQEDTSIFRGRPYLKRPELREELRKASPYIPGTDSKIFRKGERLALLEKFLPPKKYGEFITPKKIKDATKKFERSMWGKPHKERFQMEREIRYLKKHFGPGIKNKQR